MLVPFLYIICSSFHLHESYDVGTIISSILHVRTLKHETSNLPKVILLVSRKDGPRIPVCSASTLCLELGHAASLVGSLIDCGPASL